MSNPDHRLILVEGLPGTGKTTRAQTIASELRAAGDPVHLCLEGDLHPVDMQWISRMSPESWNSAVDTLHKAWQESPQSENWKSIIDRLSRLSVKASGFVHTAYTRLDFRDLELWESLDAFRDSEIHDARISYSEYRQIYLQRWSAFARSAQQQPGSYIFECAFFQSHITELLGHHLVHEDQIVEFLCELIEPGRFLIPQIQYIRPLDYAARICETAQSRGDWLESVITWVETSPYGKKNSLTGFDGILQFFAHREEIEKLAMQRLNIPVLFIDR